MIIGRVEKTATIVDDSVKVIDTKTFAEFHRMIYTITPKSDTQVWVGEIRNAEIKLLSSQSREQVSRGLAHTFIILSNGDFIVTGSRCQEIRRVTSAGKVSIIADTKPLHPRFISKTKTDDFLVSLEDDGDRFNLKPSRRRLVQRMTISGKVLHTYEFQGDGITRLFIFPGRATENDNCDICAINRTSSKTGELIVLHGDGRVRTNYLGQDDSEFKLYPFDVACDSKRRIVVSDCNNKCLHLLSQSGIFLRYLLFDMFDHPITMALQQDSLWIGFWEGAVKVYKYTD